MGEFEGCEVVDGTLGLVKERGTCTIVGTDEVVEVDGVENMELYENLNSLKSTSSEM